MAKVSISHAWDETRAILARDGKLIATVALALIVLPGLVVNVLLPRGTSLPPPQQVIWGIGGLVALLVTFVGQLSVVRLAMGPQTSVGDAIRHAATRVLPFFGAFLMWVLPVLILGSFPYAIIQKNASAPGTLAGLLLILVMVVGVALAVRLMLIGPVAVAEKGSSFTILRRSWELTAGNWWRLFGFLIIFAVGAIALLIAVSSVLGVLARLMLGNVSSLSLAGIVLVLIGQVLTAAIYVVLFVMQARIYGQLAGRHEAQAGVPSSGI